VVGSGGGEGDSSRCTYFAGNIPTGSTWVGVPVTCDMFAMLLGSIL